MGASLTITVGRGTGLVQIAEDLEVAMTYSNTGVVLNALGYEFDHENCMSEVMTVQEVWAACNLFLQSDMAELVDHGRPVCTGVGAAGATWIDCGRREGYIADKVERIRDALAQGMLQGGMFCYFA